MRIVITGIAGFIGFHIARSLSESGEEVFGLDSINHYYDVNLKLGRLKCLGLEKTDEYGKWYTSDLYQNLSFQKIQIEDKDSLARFISDSRPELIINLAAQAGVRYSIDNPYAYLDSNLTGFLNILEVSRSVGVKKIIFASSSSVYGLNTKMPFSEDDKVDMPVSLYAATKKANELMAHSYSHLYGIETIGLRFFTVYGPWGRPDMALFKFTQDIIAGKQIKVFNNGQMKRDFTYIDDVVSAVKAIVKEKKSDDSLYKIYNIGRGEPENLMDFVHEIEECLGLNAIIDFLPLQPGDVVETWADTNKFISKYSVVPKVSIKSGVQKFVEWYKFFYDV